MKYVESDPARQLFDFNDPNSAISQEYYAALHNVLSSGAKFIAVGSWYDQVVPLYSATLHGISHPNIYRALYINAADYQPDFLSHLIVFALKLRNAGYSDHGVIVHLSDVLAGNIYGFGTQGHYAIYEEENTYTIAVAWAVGTKPLWKTQTNRPRNGLQLDSAPINRSISDILIDPPFEAPHRLNPYHLPWIMAQLLGDSNIRNDSKLSKDLADLLRLFNEWEVGGSRALKDIKYRLEPIRSRL